MNFLKKLFSFYLDASIHVAISLYFLVRLTGLLFEVPIDFHLAVFLGFGTMAGYNFVKYGLEQHKYFWVVNRYHRVIQSVSLIAVICGGYFALFLEVQTYVAVAVLMLITLLYAIPVLPHAKNLRSFSGLKIIIVAVVWGGVTVVLPIVEEGSLILSWDTGIEVVQRILMVLALMLPFEIRDLNFDAPELHTLPQRFGIKNTKLIGYSWIVICFLLTFFKDDLHKNEVLVKVIICITLILVLALSKKENGKYYATFWVEALPIFWFAAAYTIAALT